MNDDGKREPDVAVDRNRREKERRRKRSVSIYLYTAGTRILSDDRGRIGCTRERWGKNTVSRTSSDGAAKDTEGRRDTRQTFRGRN
jgi:hypothetical protein